MQLPDLYNACGAYLKLPGLHTSFGRNKGTEGQLMRLPTFATVRSALKEVRRIDKQNGHPLTRGSVEGAYADCLDWLNPKDD